MQDIEKPNLFREFFDDVEETGGLRETVAVGAVIGDRVMGVNAFQVEIREFHSFFCDLDDIFFENAESAHTGIEFEMNFGDFILADRFRADFLSGFDIGDSEDDVIFHGGRDLVIEDCAEDLDRFAEFYQRQSFFEFSDTESGGAGTVKPFCDFLHAESIGIRFQDREDLKRFYRLLDMFEIAFEGIEIDFEPNSAFGDFVFSHFLLHNLFRD